MPSPSQPPKKYVSPEHFSFTEAIIRRFQQSNPSYLHGDIRSAGLLGLSSAISRFDEEKGLNKSFITVCVRNAILDTLSKERRYRGYVQATEDSDRAQATSDFKLSAEPDELLQRKRIIEAAQQVQPNGQLVRLVLEGYTHKEIGGMLGISTGAVAIRLHRSIKKIRASILGTPEKAAA